MKRFELRANRNNLIATQKMLLTSGSINVYPVLICFSSDWDGLDKRAVFRAGSTDEIVFSVEPDENGSCIIPWEVLTEPEKTLYAGVYGTSGDEIVLPTIWTELGFIYQGSKPGEGSGPPTPDAWQQLKDDLKKATEELEDIKQYTTSAGESADRAEEARKGAEEAAKKTVEETTELLSGYVQEANEAKDGSISAQQESERARDEANEHREAAKLSATEADQSKKDAEKAKEDAEKAANNAAGEIVEQLAGYVQDAKTALNGAITAQEGAETARTEAEEHRDAAKKSEEESLKNANKAVEYSGKPPIIKDGTWWTWDAEKGAYVDTGEPANLNPRGEYDPEATYQWMDVVRYDGNGWICLKNDTAGTEPVEGETWMLHVEKGKSAYQQAVDGGLSATEPQFQSALAKVVDAWGNWHYDLTDEEMSDPDIVYERTRPIDWMKMPAMEDVQDGEFWLLFQWFPRDIAECSFRLHSDTDIKVEAGRYEDGVFTAQEKYTQDYHPANPDANTTVKISLDGADFGDMTSSGLVQAMVRISGGLRYIVNVTSDIHTDYYVDVAVRSSKLLQLQLTNTYYMAYLAIVDVANSAGDFAFMGCVRLMAVRGTGAGFNWSNVGEQLFTNCYMLMAIPADTTLSGMILSQPFLNCRNLRFFPAGVTFGAVSNGYRLLEGCYSLRELPPRVTFANVANANSVLLNCYALRKLPPGVSFASAVNGNAMLKNCCALLELLNAYFPAATVLDEALSGCVSLQRITNLYIPSCSSIKNAFGGCRMLEELTFDPRMETWETPCDISLTNTALSHAAIVNLFNTLPTIETPKTITLTGTPGASQVTAEDVAIATAKGWLVAGVPAGIATGSPGGTEGPEIFDDVDTGREPYFVDEDGKRFYGPFYQS